MSGEENFLMFGKTQSALEDRMEKSLAAFENKTKITETVNAYEIRSYCAICKLNEHDTDYCKRKTILLGTNVVKLATMQNFASHVNLITENNRNNNNAMITAAKIIPEKRRFTFHKTKHRPGKDEPLGCSIFYVQ